MRKLVLLALLLSTPAYADDARPIDVLAEEEALQETFLDTYR